MFPTEVDRRSKATLTRLVRVQTPPSNSNSSVAGSASATGASEALAAERDADPQWHAWVERQPSDAIALPQPSRTPPSQAKARFAAIAERRQLAHEPTTDGAPTAIPQSAHGAPSGSPPPLPPRSRKQKLKSALAAIHLEESIARRAASKAAKRVIAIEAVWSPNREKRAVEARAKQREIMERVPAARARWRALVLDPTTAHFAIALKKLCDERGWTLADECARRLLTLIEFFREFARPMCWNAHRVRAPLARGLGRTGAVLERSKRKSSPCVTAIAQPFLATVIAGAGHSPTDNRAVCCKTVGRLTALLEAVGILQAVQVPARAAESYEVGPSGHAINRYWLADKGSPKPALMGLWSVDGDLLDVAILEEPWRGAVVAMPPATAPP